MAIETAVKIDIEVTGDGTVKQAAGLYKDLGEAVSETQLRAEELAKKYGILDSRTQKAIEVAGKYKNELEQLDFAIDAAKGGSDQLFRASQGIVGGFEAAAGSMALFGSESEELEKIMLKVQGAMVLSQGLKDFNEFAPAIKNVGQSFLDALKSVRTFSKGAKIALASTGVGALIVGVGLLIEYFSDLADSVGDVDLKQQGLNETTEEYNKSVASTTKEIKDVGQAFELAKDGVISKEEALYQYNETLGDVLGAANSLEEAEANYVAKTDAYIKATALRRQADVLLEKAAQANADALTATANKQIASTENFILSGQKLMGAFIDDVTGNAFKQEQQAEKLQKNLGNVRLKRYKKEKEEQANAFTDLAESLTKEAVEIEKTNNIKSKSNKSYRDKQKAANDKAAADELAALKKKGELEKKFYQDRLARIQKQNQEELSEYEKLNQLLLSIEVEKLNARGQNLDAEILQLEDRYKKELELAKGNAQKTFFIEQRRLIELEQLRKKYDNETDKNIQSVFEKRKAQDDARKAVELRRQEIFQQKLADSYTAINNLTSAAQQFVTNSSAKLDEDFQNRIDRLKDLGYTEEQIANMRDKELKKIDERGKKAFELEKGLRYTQTLLSTIEGVQNAFTTANKSPLTAVFPAYPYVQAGAAAAFGIAQLQQIKQSKYQSKMLPKSQSDSGGVPTSPGVPQMNAPRLGGQLVTDNELTGERKVYVVESDITATQKRVANSERVSLVE